MTTIYVPRLIESVEQAEALPSGTQRLQDGREGLAIGWTALVPIEAREERVERIEYSPLGYETNVYSETRLVTSWEEA